MSPAVALAIAAASFIAGMGVVSVVFFFLFRMMRATVSLAKWAFAWAVTLAVFGVFGVGLYIALVAG
jgi:hypothetical protein